MHSISGNKLAYSELVDKAGQMELPAESDLALKDPKEFTIIGTNIGRYDNPQIVRGKTTFGMDVRLPDMLFASIALPPTLGAKLVNTDDSATLKVSGVKKVVPLSYGVAVLADNTWAAMRGRDALQLTWEGGRNFNSEAIEQDLLAKAGETPAEADELVGVYVFPYFGHVTMEPMNCTADVRADSCEVWVPTQNPQGVQSNAAIWSRLSNDKVRVNVTLVGGGFGRRLESALISGPPIETDYVAQAVNLSKLVGAPVQIVWTREDDIAHDLFHPISVYRVSAKLNDIEKPRLRRFESFEQVPTGYWRSVTNPPEAFAHECFMDDYAAATGINPLELRRQLLPANAMAVIDLAAEKAGWGQPLPAGHGLGLAYHSTWGVTGVAMLAEVSVTSGALTVHRVVAAVDCGRAINPDMVVAQIESGIVFGLTTVLKKNIHIENGQVQHSNFSDYPILRFDEMPQIEVHILPSEDGPSGVGEMANPPLAPAVANAVFAATGMRIRRVPIRKEDLVGS